MSIDFKRIGSVPYLNARPLIYGIEDQIVLQVPSVLSKNLRAGELDVALVPVAEYFENPQYQIIPGIAIASKGNIDSVYVYYQGDLKDIKQIVLDPSSKTSNMLVQVIFLEFLKINVKFVASSKKNEPHLLIGDPALVQKNLLTKEGFQLLDLGEVWTKHTGLPFVYAFWAVQSKADGKSYAQFLSEKKRNGLVHINEIVGKEKNLPADLSKKYLTEVVSYEMGPDAVEGLERFQELCFKHKLITQKAPLNFVK
jgi:chorismate dehydratase